MGLAIMFTPPLAAPAVGPAAGAALSLTSVSHSLPAVSAVPLLPVLRKLSSLRWPLLALLRGELATRKSAPVLLPMLLSLGGRCKKAAREDMAACLLALTALPTLLSGSSE
jgi:hypothetical protein